MMCAQHFNGLARRSSGGDDVFNDHDAIALSVGTFDLTPGSVRLGFLAHREGAKRPRG